MAIIGQAGIFFYLCMCPDRLSETSRTHCRTFFRSIETNINIIHRIYGDAPTFYVPFRKWPRGNFIASSHFIHQDFIGLGHLIVAWNARCVCYGNFHYRAPENCAQAKNRHQHLCFTGCVSKHCESQRRFSISFPYFTAQGFLCVNGKIFYKLAKFTQMWRKWNHNTVDTSYR